MYRIYVYSVCIFCTEYIDSMYGIFISSISRGSFRYWLCISFSAAMPLLLMTYMYIYIELKANTIPIGPKHKMAVLVPFRDCHEELQQFAPHIFKYLTDIGIAHNIYVINQMDNFRFNRAALINVGFLNMDPDCDYIVMHDVDHLEVNPNFDFRYPRNGPVHLSYSKYVGHVGGVLLMTNEHYRMFNGMSNDFWGWDKEGDDLYKRMTKVGLQASQQIRSNLSNFKYIPDENRRPRDKEIYSNQLQFQKNLDMRTGLNSTNYIMHSRNTTIVNGARVYFVNVHLLCDVTKTPFCQKNDGPVARENDVTQENVGHSGPVKTTEAESEDTTNGVTSQIPDLSRIHAEETLRDMQEVDVSLANLRRKAAGYLNEVKQDSNAIFWEKKNTEKKVGINRWSNK